MPSNKKDIQEIEQSLKHSKIALFAILAFIALLTYLVISISNQVSTQQASSASDAFINLGQLRRGFAPAPEPLGEPGFDFEKAQCGKVCTPGFNMCEEGTTCTKYYQGASVCLPDQAISCGELREQKESEEEIGPDDIVGTYPRQCDLGQACIFFDDNPEACNTIQIQTPGRLPEVRGGDTPDIPELPSRFEGCSYDYETSRCVPQYRLESRVPTITVQ